MKFKEYDVVLCRRVYYGDDKYPNWYNELVDNNIPCSIVETAYRGRTAVLQPWVELPQLGRRTFSVPTADLELVLLYVEV